MIRHECTFDHISMVPGRLNICWRLALPLVTCSTWMSYFLTPSVF